MLFSICMFCKKNICVLIFGDMAKEQSCSKSPNNYKKHIRKWKDEKHETSTRRVIYPYHDLFLSFVWSMFYFIDLFCMPILFLNENTFYLGLKFLKSTNKGIECWLTFSFCLWKKKFGIIYCPNTAEWQCLQILSTLRMRRLFSCASLANIVNILFPFYKSI